jgi:hypothetical protein
MQIEILRRNLLVSSLREKHLPFFSSKGVGSNHVMLIELLFTGMYM